MDPTATESQGEVAALLRTGRLAEALATLQAQVRGRPGAVEPRIMLFAVECVLGRWDKAGNQLDAIASLSQEWSLPALVYRQLIRCEAQRREVFAGRARPVILGEPPPWAAWNVEACALEAQGRSREAWDLRARARDESPALAGKVNGQDFAWIQDADLRWGPLLEVYLEGAYQWIPFTQLRQIEVASPTVLVETVWTPTRLVLSTGAAIHAHLPVRYPGSEDSEDWSIRMARQTDWRSVEGGEQAGLGQRLLATDVGDFALCECQEIVLGTGEPEAAGTHE